MDAGNNSKISYQLIENKYWDLRDKRDWSEIPNIYKDDCKPFM